MGLAHEKGNYKQFKKSQSENGEVPDSLSSEMDLQNNHLGIRLGQANKRLTYEELSDLILTEIEMGKAFIMKRSTIGMYLRCDEQPLILNDYKGVWSVPKCMTESNYTYPWKHF